MHRRLAPVLLSAVVAACSTDAPLASEAIEASATRTSGASYTYDVTITNLTYGQPFSPAVLVTHAPRASLFRVNTKASMGIRAIAEDGNPAVSAAMLAGAPGVFDVVTTGAPVHVMGGPGPNVLMTSITSADERGLFSLATMLICSNDGFTGLSGVALPADNYPVTYYAQGYDSGTERNTEVAGDIVPPCFGIGPVKGPIGGGGRVAESGQIRMHSGIMGGADLVPAQHGWNGPVAKITIQRVGTT